MPDARSSSDEASHPISAEAPPEPDTALAHDEQVSWKQFVWDDARSTNAADHPASPETRPIETAKPDLPRIVAPQPAATGASAPERHEEWRRQFISALKEVDDNAPIPAPHSAPATVRHAPAPLPRADDRSDLGRRPLAYMREAEPRRTVAPRMVARAVGAGALALGTFSTGALWATYKPDAAAELDLQTASIAVVESKADGQSSQPPAEQPMVNPPFLVREGEATPPAPVPDTSAWRQPPAATSVPPAPRPEVSAPVPPLIINRTVTVHSVPAFEPRPATPSSLKAEDHGNQHHAATRHEASPSAPPRHNTRVTAGAYQSPAPATTQSDPRPKWERRQGLRTAPPPEPEPSTLKKLLKAVWPGTASTTTAPSKPAAPTATPIPAASGGTPHDWSSKSGADP